MQRKDFPETDVPNVTLSGLLNGRSSIPIVDLLLDTGLAPTRSAARRLIEQSGVRLNGWKVGQERNVSHGELPLELRAEKRRAVRLR